MARHGVLFRAWWDLDVSIIWPGIFLNPGGTGDRPEPMTATSDPRLYIVGPGNSFLLITNPTFETFSIRFFGNFALWQLILGLTLLVCLIFIFSHVFGGPKLRQYNYFAAESPVLTVHMMWSLISRAATHRAAPLLSHHQQKWINLCGNSALMRTLWIVFVETRIWSCKIKLIHI